MYKKNSSVVYDPKNRKNAQELMDILKVNSNLKHPLFPGMGNCFNQLINYLIVMKKFRVINNNDNFS